MVVPESFARNGPGANGNRQEAGEEPIIGRAGGALRADSLCLTSADTGAECLYTAGPRFAAEGL